MRLSDRYGVINRKQGGMGEVFICTDRKNDNKVVALKTYRSDLDNPDIRELFIREARAWIKIGIGEFILFPEGIEVISGKPFIILPYCKNGSLKELLEQRSLTKEEAITLLAQLALGMHRISDIDGLVHQDLKPENILLDDLGRPLIADLGIVKAICNCSPDKETLISLQGTNAGMGTLPYMSPEQLNGQVADARADIYAFGLIFYEMLCGQQAMSGKTHEELFSKIFQGMEARLAPIANNYGKKSTELIKKCTEINRENRPKNFRVVIDLIDELVDPAPYGKSLGWFKSDDRIKIKEKTTVLGWSFIFPERGPKDIARAHYSYKEPRMLSQANDLRKIGNHSEAIKVCWNILGDTDETNSNFNKLLAAFMSGTTKYAMYDIERNSTKMNISGGIGLYFSTLELMLAAYVDAIESSKDDMTQYSALIQKADSIADILVTCKFTPLEILLLCGQLKIKADKYDAARSLLTLVANDSDGLLKHRAYGGLVVLLKDIKDFDSLEDLVNNEFIPELIEDESFMAQRVCGVGLAAIHEFELAAVCFFKAYKLGNNDLWSLMQAGVAKSNARDMKSAEKICDILKELAPNSVFYNSLYGLINSQK